MARPVKRFHEFNGQQPVAEHVERLIHGAKVCGDACTSLLLVGAAGSGKTSIAKAVAAEYGSDIHMLLAGSDTKPAEICELLREARHGDMVLIDEGHALGSDAQKILYLALDEWRGWSTTCC
jgi:holliday junction DNA helicase RuvB